ncbi:oligopeptide ABC transporter permease protein [Mycoplasmopsis californica HAZ160_1]|uniref:Oligopeptide ABC transporter permease protein n=2 Tax=Mycoplasmopsis californica TaxID=2113 RepID=A0AAT9F7X8_9BACT|nr:ABC transporter permease subunit [Mycoplasmopsis californica]BAP01012.1 oligopeptide ABC transporter permease protein [Mycoplasmopsis californica HAZ160_1]BBG40877.1 oligopeptide ABC transporter permease protein [Mycoplasmopsis californica]BBG41471.1 oligopeptide ABC transporter permease protein [Mycoplasmopsis californica]BBG42064.1 oligopeptide ABC transporter permease protein [Mycoplasmopsis californica]BBG42647.1 oligopeptide ABC transporter permease protein [Mycoplasmopsis californica]
MSLMKFLNVLMYVFKSAGLNFLIILATIFSFNLAMGSFLLSDYTIYDSFNYLGNLLKFNYGDLNLSSKMSINSVFNQYFGFSLLLVTISFIFIFVLGFALAYWMCKWTKNKFLTILNSFLIALSSIPIFIFGSFVLIFNKQIALPITYIDTYYGSIAATAFSLLTPILALVLFVLPLNIAINYPIIYKIIFSDYYLWAKANGMSNFKIFWAVLVRNWISHYLQNIIFIYIYLMTYAMVLERFFYMPGQSFIFQYLKSAEYFLLLNYAILLNVVIIFVIKEICLLAIYVLDEKRKYFQFWSGVFKWRK